jgi:hypothetical protein
VEAAHGGVKVWNTPAGPVAVADARRAVVLLDPRTGRVTRELPYAPQRAVAGGHYLTWSAGRLRAYAINR